MLKGYVLSLSGVQGYVYVLVTHEGADFNRTRSQYTLRAIDYSLKIPLLTKRTVAAARQTDTTLRLVWDTAQDPLGLGHLQYAIYGYARKPAYLLNLLGYGTSADMDRSYFMKTLCSADAGATLLRPFSTLALTLRGESFIISKNNRTLHWDLENLQNGFIYQFVVFVRNELGQVSAYDVLTTKTWQIGPTGTAVLVVLLIVFVVCMGTYLYLYKAAARDRGSLFVSANKLPKKARHFAAADIEGYFYVLPKRVLRSLAPDEEVVWAGRPDYALYTYYWARCYCVIAVCQMLILLVIGWLYTETWTHSILWPYLLVYFFFSALFFVTIPHPRTTVYVLTNKRAITYLRYFWVLPVSRSHPYEQMYAGHIKTELQSNQGGNVFFDREQSYLFCKKKPIGFWYVANAKRAILHINHYRGEFYKTYFMHSEGFSFRGNEDDDD